MMRISFHAQLIDIYSQRRYAWSNSKTRQERDVYEGPYISTRNCQMDLWDKI